ncbi:MAG: hypothetical protein KAT43_02255 [Nanoarchaeota archaeon]|nr:hypothetical protein [Nanoarchaeota archaeon]
MAKKTARQKALQKEILDKMVTLLIAAFGLVAALAWNDTIKALFKHFLGTPDSVPAMLTYAILVTVLAVVVTLVVSRMAARMK